MEWEKQRTWAEVSMSALENNYRVLRAMLRSDCRFMGVVKTNAYGHGAVQIAHKLVELGSEMLGVACLTEALELRQAGITAPILILGYTQPAFAAQVVEHDITQTVFEPELARALSEEAARQGKTARVHVKLDTGMGRVGVLAHDPRFAAGQVAQLCALPNLEPEGIFTHFANADGDEEYTMLQFTRFLDTISILEKDYSLTFAIRHCAASAATLNYPCTHLDMVRPGIATYGHYPDPGCCKPDGEGLKPLMTVCTRVGSVQQLPEGTPVSYGCTNTLRRDSRIAMLLMGYGDGMERQLSNRFWVEFQGRRAPIVGRVCMDMFMVDVTDLPDVKPGDVAVVFGTDKPLEEAADLVGTIQYELLCGIAPRVPRIYLP